MRIAYALGIAIVAVLPIVIVACGSEEEQASPSPDAGDDSPSGFDGTLGGDGAPSGDSGQDAGNPNVNAQGCSGTQVNCAGKCVVTSVDPNNCGACGTKCAANQVCYSSGCAANCPQGLDACAGSCVDRSTSNDHCGTCGNKCGAGKGCVGGSCVDAVPVGPAPAKCAGGGPPIVVGGMTTPTCTGKLAQISFTHALCSCTDIGVPALSSDTFVDAFDSKGGPYTPNGLGGSIGANGALKNTSKLQVYGDIRVSGAPGFTVGGETDARLELHVAGPLVLNQKVDVAQNAIVNGAISGNAEMKVGKTLFTPSCGSVPQNVTAATCTAGGPTVKDPCACKPADIVPVSAIVAHHSSPANNDNALINLSPAVFDNPGAPSRLDLPCGYYYLNRINVAGQLVIAVHGPTALFIGGSISVGSAITFTLDPGATLDVFVGGTVVASAKLTVGSKAYPAGSRFYVGGICKGAGVSCALAADCCSNACTSGSCVGAGVTPPFSVNLTSNTDLNGLFYSANAGFRTSSDLEMFGAVFGGYYHSTSNTRIHYDRAATTLADECPAPGAGSGGKDGGVSGTPCGSCRDCGNQACVSGKCGACTSGADCCSPLACVAGQCVPPPIK